MLELNLICQTYLSSPEMDTIHQVSVSYIEHFIQVFH